ncbi:MAG: cobalt-precorrin-4/precorrin-4 C(11)-methyltransferase, partial [Selenomonas sp.]|nr:cobalt-precorrin-4/precorrin-4 C(11)-methyltransferase [Selenomonas sp.]
MVHIVGAGPGDPELITVKGQRYLREADVVIYAGSLVNPALLELCKPGAEIHNSASMTLDEVVAVIENAEQKGQVTVRLHTGDPSVYGAIQEQMDAFSKKGIAYDIVPGVSSCFATAAALKQEYTLPGISQTVIITRNE